MTRKRLKKLLMAYGVERNSAEIIAQAYRRAGITYLTAYFMLGGFQP